MGMYTEFIIGFKFKENTPKNIIEIVKTICSEGDDKRNDICRIELPEHPFFQFDNWQNILLCNGSFYFGVSVNRATIYDDHGWVVDARFNTQNVCVAENFLNWVKPYIECGSGYRQFYAISCHENDVAPQFYYLDPYTKKEIRDGYLIIGDEYKCNTSNAEMVIDVFGKRVKERILSNRIFGKRVILTNLIPLSNGKIEINFAYYSKNHNVNSGKYYMTYIKDALIRE